MPFDITHCVACGKKIDLYGDHHCDPKFEKMRETIDRREREPRVFGWTEAQRLSFGFQMMSLNGDFG